MTDTVRLQHLSKTVAQQIMDDAEREGGMTLELLQNGIESYILSISGTGKPVFTIDDTVTVDLPIHVDDGRPDFLVHDSTEWRTADGRLIVRFKIDWSRAAVGFV